jgi:DNA-binding response OmpR family regulator
MPLARAVAENGTSDPAIQTLLVVEDEVLIRSTVAEFLREAGYRVFEAVDVAEAKAVLSTGTSIDLVFSDVTMPGGENGFALADWIRQHHPHVLVLLASGFADTAKKGSTRSADVPLLPKPYAVDLLLERIRRLLGQAQSGGSSGSR